MITFHRAALLKEQYQLVKDARAALLDYCGQLRPEDVVKTVESFGHGGSIRNVLVHVANVYQHWIGRFAMTLDEGYAAAQEFETIEAIAGLFLSVDKQMSRFIEQWGNATHRIAGHVDGKKRVIDPLVLFTHVITHEFHHKGQILSISRHLGYTPIDTDIIR